MENQEKIGDRFLMSLADSSNGALT